MRTDGSDHDARPVTYSGTVDVTLEDQLSCHRCAGPAILETRVPHVIERADGDHVDGTRGVVLCPVCDTDDPDAQGLLALFAVHETITDEVIESAASLIIEWTSRVADRPEPKATDVEPADLDEYWSELDQ